MLASIAELNLGGREINEILIQNFATKYQTYTGQDMLKDNKTYWDVMDKVEDLKKHLSNNSFGKILLDLPMTNETGGGTTEIILSRPEFDELCSQLFVRIESSLRKCLAGTGTLRKSQNDTFHFL